jgi:hypothetical protein
MSADDTLFLWNDAICIDQANESEALDECSKQVAMMREVYDSAAEVFVWLGKLQCEKSNKIAFAKMRELPCVYEEAESKLQKGEVVERMNPSSSSTSSSP